MTDKSKFVEGEWAVLRHDSGGRLFEVGGSQLESNGQWRAWEARHGPWKDQPKHYYWETGLVKVGSKTEAEKLVALYDYIGGVYKTKEGELRRERQKEFDFVTRCLEVYTDE